MTENRFTIFNMGLDGQFIKENGKIITIERAVDLLNKNEQLKQQIQRERTSHTKQHFKWSNEAETKIKELKKENEDLKQSNKDAIQILKKEFDFANEQRQKHLDDPVVVNAYDIIRYDMRRALDKLGDFE